MMNAGQANWPTILTHHPLTNGLWEGRVRHEINLPDGSRDRNRERLMDDPSNRLRLLLKGLFLLLFYISKVNNNSGPFWLSTNQRCDALVEEIDVQRQKLFLLSSTVIIILVLLLSK